MDFMSSRDVINKRRGEEQQPEEREACLLMTRRACENSQVSMRAWCMCLLCFIST